MVNDNRKCFQIQRRTRKLTVPCDKLSNHIWNYPADEYAEIIENRDQCGCVEGTVKKKKIVTSYWLELVGEYQSLIPPNAFDREVFFHAVSAFEQGTKVITIRTALHSLTAGNQERVRNDQYEALKAAFDKLGFTRIKINLAPLLKAYPKYRNGCDRAELVGCLLPLQYYETAEVNGQKTLVIELLGESPLMTVAKLKRQILTYDATPLNIPNQNNTPQVITVKNYLLRRIKLVERGLSPIILFKTLYENCGLADATDSIKQNVRKEIVDILKSFKTDGVIKNFELERQGKAYRNIKITLPKSPKTSDFLL